MFGLFKLSAMASVEETINLGEHDADAVPEVCLFRCPRFLLFLEVYVLCEFHDDDCEEEDGEGPDVFDGSEEVGFFFFDDLLM